MDPRLKAIVARVKAMPRENPDSEPVNPGKVFELELLRSGHADEFTEADVVKALREVGVPEDEHISWMEDFASWL